MGTRETSALRCIWCGEFPVIRVNFARLELGCKCPIIRTSSTKANLFSDWDKRIKKNAELQGFFISMPLEDLPKYINTPQAYSQFIVQQRLAGEDYSLEAFNGVDKGD